MDGGVSHHANAHEEPRVEELEFVLEGEVVPTCARRIDVEGAGGTRFGVL